MSATHQDQGEQDVPSARNVPIAETPLTDALDSFTKEEYTRKVYALFEHARSLETALRASQSRESALADALKHEEDVAQKHMDLYTQRLREGDESCRPLGSEAWRRRERIRAALTTHASKDMKL